MGLVATEPEGREIELIPEDTYHSICYMVVDLGTQHNERFNTDTRKVQIGFEIPDVRIDIERDGQMVNLPRAISQEFTLSLHKKAKLRAYLESWRGRAFTKDELAGFDLVNLLGVNCMLQVLHRTSEAGRTYQTIANLNKLYRGMEVRQTENEHQYFSFDDNMDIPNLPEWIRKKIEDSYEYQELMDGSQEAVDEGTGYISENDDIPF